MQGEQRIALVGGRRKENAARIARPYAVGAPAMKADVVGERVGSRLLEYRARLFSARSLLTIRSTRSWRARLRMISA